MTDVRTMTVGELLRDAAVCHEYDSKPCLCGQCDAARELARRAGLWEQVELFRGYLDLTPLAGGHWECSMVAPNEPERAKVAPTAREAVEKALGETR